MYHPPPGSHGSMANCVALLMKHLPLCLLMSERLYQSHPASGAVCSSSRTSAVDLVVFCYWWKWLKKYAFELLD